jgi:hypothetical protein
MNHDLLINILTLIATAITFPVLFMQGSKNRSAWGWAIVAQCIWFIIYLYTHIWVMLAVVLVKQILNIRALVKWRKA